MRTLLKFIVIAPIALALLVFAFANRQIVTVSLDPFASEDNPALALAAPLFLVVLLTLMAGVVVGGAATWLSQRRFRRAARQSRAEADRLRNDARARADAASSSDLARRA